ncbi:Ferric-chelate reductase 1 [Orchesella cincta]|uniref:Ferric-chelate reductase 1 n=1 Tax=Orchesella cincta TaxID=48709 RepID=A0A1D2NEZ1_ORCCI|nr:Ferric-chelate reductase 1 [Orchesella cincta]
MKPLKGVCITCLHIVLLLQGLQADHTSLCINLPKLYYKTSHYGSIGMDKFPQTNIWQLLQEVQFGGEMLHDTAMRGHIDDFKGGVYPKGELNVYRIKNAGDYLNGWFRVEVRFEGDASKADMHSGLIGMILFARDDHYRRQHIGEFVNNFPTVDQYPPLSTGSSCATNDATKYMIISCGGASSAEPLVSNMIVLMRDNPKDGNGKSIWPDGVDSTKIIPDLVGTNRLNFYIRIPIQDCNQKKAIIFRAKLLIDKDYTGDVSHVPRNIVRQLTTVLWLEPSAVPGIADPIPPPKRHKDLRCDEKIDKNVNLPWYLDTKSGLPFQSGNIPHAFSKYLGIRHIHGCQGLYFVGRCKYSYYDMFTSLYAGSSSSESRLRYILNQNEAQTDFAPHCEAWRLRKASSSDNEGFDLEYYIKPKEFYANQKELIPFKKTTQYLKDTEVKCNVSGYNGDPMCNITRSGFPTTRLIIRSGGGPFARSRSLSFDGFDGFDFISGYTKSNDSTENMYLGVQFELGGYSRFVWGLRQGHATIMSIIVLFILPINLFMTRYYKESFMKQRVLLTRIWYQVHIHGTFLSGALLAASLGIAYMASTYLGKSLTVAGGFHRIVGYITVFLFVALFGLGGFRGYEDTLRRFSILLHWLTGTLVYVLMLVLMMNGVFIPGSGVASKDQSQLRVVGDEEMGYMSGTFAHVIVWILFEVVVHAIMTGNLIAFDLKMVVIQKRKYLPVPIPVIKEHSSTDAFGHGLRVIILFVYIAAAFSSTLLYLILIISTKWEGKGFGPMSCTHDDSWAILENIPDRCRIP